MTTKRSRSFRNAILRWLCRAYPCRKGRYKWMCVCEGMLDKHEETVEDLYSKYKFALNLGNRGLESSFYYLIPEFYECGTQRYIRETVKEGMVALDIGSHLGLITILLADQVGSTGKVYSFEPEARNFERLAVNIRLNNLKQVVPSRLALSDRSGVEYLSLQKNNSAHRLASLGDPLARQRGRTQEVKTITLDDFIEQSQIKEVHLIKIDAEGSEVRILNGAVKTLSGNAALQIICEIHSSRNQTEVGQDRARKVFYSFGYRSYILDTQLSPRKYLSELRADEPVFGLQNILFKK